MFFQINVTPTEKKPKEPKRQVQVNSYNLLLAPFQPPTRIILNANINTRTECQLTINNTNKRTLSVSVVKSPPEERCVSLSESEWTLEPESTVTLNILWEPKEAGSWRDILQLSDSRRIKYDVSMALTCINPNKVANGKSKKGGSTIKPTEVKNFKKYEPTRKKISRIDNNEKIVKQKVQTQVKESTLKKTEFANKENVSSNVGFNWMLEQAKVKQQKKEYLSPPPQSLNFSKLLDTSSFKFTPVKAKFPCYESDAVTHNTVKFLPKYGVENIDESELFEKESSTVTIESKVQVTLRKETYVKVPKCINTQNVSPTYEKIKDENSEEFDDSLSPKLEELETQKSHSEFSMLLNDLKFTPFKNSNDNMKFSPNICSTVSKVNKNKLLNDDLCVQEKNATFSIEKKDDTYELPSSPTSTKNNFALKPTCLAKSFDTHVTSFANATGDYMGISNNFSRSQMDFGSAKDCLEADLWVKSKNTSLSPNPKNIMHSTLDSITEEDIYGNDIADKKYNNSSDSSQKSKKSNAVCLEISPPKTFRKPAIRKVSPTKYSKIKKEKTMAEKITFKKRIKINESIKSNSKTQIPGVRIAKLSLAGLSIMKNKNNDKNLKKQKKEVAVKLHDPNDFLSMFCNPDPFAATMTHDPFLTSTFYYDDKWIYEQELAFKKWLNALLTPLEELASDESSTIDIGKVWQSCRAKENVTLAETKESVSARYHTNTRLNTLRKAACVMFRKPEVITALTQTTVGIEKEILVIRTDRDLHRDIGLQKIILELFISYNPLWLRIGLEAVYGETIPLQSNNDIIGLSRFLLNRFFSDPFLVKMHSVNSHPTLRLGTFQPLMNKFMLKKFLFLVYFLDYAKRNKLIGHDPCLFRKGATVKDSRSMLLTFSRELLSGIGDITKVLRNYHYVVSHKQSYLDEYDYAVKELSTDLRDGVRLCRVMELITGKRCLTSQCRVPAISRLQKVHNVNISLSTLKEAGYTITGDIDGKSIADGHKEKTLSLLWQIIYKFQAPRYEKAAKTLQRWWRSKLYYVLVKKFLRTRRDNAASVIQRAWRCHLARKQLSVLKQRHAEQMLLKVNAAVVIQTRWRLKKEAERQRRRYERTKESILKIQKCWRNFKTCRPYAEEFKRKRKLVVALQRRWRATRSMKQQRVQFLRLRVNATWIQRFWRGYCLTKQIQRHYQIERAAAKTIQAKWRGHLATRRQRTTYLKTLDSVKIIQERWRARLAGQKERRYFLSLKHSARTVEALWIARKIRRELEKRQPLSLERQYFLQLKSKASLVQRVWRNKRATRSDVELFKRKRSACMKIQSWWRRIVLARATRRHFLAVREAAILGQTIWRRKMEARRVSAERQALREASASTIQHWYRSIAAGRLARREYLRKKAAVRVIEDRRLAVKLGRERRREYANLKRAAVLFQRKWRAQLAMRRERRNYVNLVAAAGTVQAWWRMIRQKRRYNELLGRVKAALVLQTRWRASVRARLDRTKYLEDRSKVIYIQRKWRALCLARVERSRYLTVQRSVLMIQSCWRSYVQRRDEHRRYIESVVKVQSWWRSTRATRDYRRKREAAVLVQANWRRYLAKRDFERKKAAVLTIEGYWSNLLTGRAERGAYLRLKSTAIRMQQLLKVKKARREFRMKREAAVKIQRFWRAVKLMRVCRLQYNQLKSAAIVLQRRYRAELIKERVRRKYLYTLSRVVIIQKWWRALLEERKRRLAVARIEDWWIVRREERRLLYIQRAELARKNRAATIIQAVWKGFKVRQAASKKLVVLRERVEQAAKAAVPSATLAFRLRETIQVFMYASSIGQLSVCLSSLDVVTRLSPNACISVCQSNLVPRLYDILTQANRSSPWLDVCLKVISILLTLAKFNLTASYILEEEYVEPLARLLTISMGKKEDLFLHTATLFWILIEDPRYAEAVNNCSRSKYLLSSLCASINKKLAKTAAQSIVKGKVDTLPSPKPDWGLRHKRPRIFTNISQAVILIASRLNILNDVQTADMQRSFNLTLK